MAKKTARLGLLLLLVTCSGLEIEACQENPVVYSRIEGCDWVKTCIERHPEVKWLASSEVRKTEEGKETLQGTYSEQIFGSKYMEFDRTIMTIRSLKLVLEGGEKAYRQFTAAQPERFKLSFESFEDLHRQGHRILESKWGDLSPLQIAEAMETALVLGDIGKSEKARAEFRPFGIQAPDHDDFYGEAIQVIAQHPHLCPSFARLPPAAQKLITQVANLAHYGHITHLEGDTRMYSKLKNTNMPSLDPVAVDFDLFVHTCDVAGALGHQNNQSSLVYTQPAHNAMQAMAESVRVLADTKKTEWDAYYAYLSTRSSWLGLSPEDSGDRVLARIAAMLRLYTKEEGEVLRSAMLSLDPILREQIAAQLDVKPGAGLGRTPTYMPAVLVNLCNNDTLGKTKEERLAQAIKIGLPFLTRVLEKHKEMMKKGEINPDIPLNFNPIAGSVKSRPDLLASRSFVIDSEGLVRLQE